MDYQRFRGADFIHVKFVAGDGQEVDSFVIDVARVLDPERQPNIRFRDVLGYDTNRRVFVAPQAPIDRKPE